ncbi:MAG TPA: hypothetical protein DEB40_11525 [Elusimicrobia bacterium]|nr:hypothetical protein [Elusimicrobiota bacterium]HBT62363.1 hypothetical protein [Elusimicrobiota bacterium]
MRQTPASRFPAPARPGQVLAGVIVLLLILSILVPAMISFVMNESKWTAKESRNTTALHLAEAGIEKGYLAISQSSATWYNLQKGQLLAGLQFNTAFTDIPGGRYTISITSGPLKNQATVISVGIDNLNRESRALKAVYASAPLEDIAIIGGNGVVVTGNNMEVEWGSVVSQGAISTGGKNHPQFWSTGAIDHDTNGATPPNCDTPSCHWWHSYNANLPPFPTLDFNFYMSSAIASGTGPCGAYYVNGNKSGSCTDASGNPYYVTGKWTNFAGDIHGVVIVLGDVETPNGNINGASESVLLPQKAWKQYSNDWAFYLAANWDSTAPAAFPGITAPYLSPANQYVTITPTIHGVLYVGGDFTGPTGGGNSDLVYGVIFVKGTVHLNMNSHVKIYYAGDIASDIQWSQPCLYRASWQDTLTPWPTGL